MCFSKAVHLHTHTHTHAVLIHVHICHLDIAHCWLGYCQTHKPHTNMGLSWIGHKTSAASTDRTSLCESTLQLTVVSVEAGLNNQAQISLKAHPADI